MSQYPVPISLKAPKEATLGAKEFSKRHGNSVGNAVAFFLRQLKADPILFADIYKDTLVRGGAELLLTSSQSKKPLSGTSMTLAPDARGLVDELPEVLGVSKEFMLRVLLAHMCLRASETLDERSEKTQPETLQQE